MRKMTLLLAALAATAVATSTTSAEPPVDQGDKLKKAFPAFATAKSSKDVLPQRSSIELSVGPASRFAVDADNARLLKHDTSHKTYLASGSENACWIRVADDASSRQVACGSIDRLVDAPSVGAGPEGDGYLVLGLAPGGSRDYRVLTADGTTVPIDTSGHAFAQRTQAVPTTLVYVATDGHEHSISLGVPHAQG